MALSVIFTFLVNFLVIVSYTYRLNQSQFDNHQLIHQSKVFWRDGFSVSSRLCVNLYTPETPLTIKLNIQSNNVKKVSRANGIRH